MAGRKKRRPTTVKEPKRGKPKHPKGLAPAGFISVTEAAMLLGNRYQRARDRILAKEFGEPHYDGRWLTVSKQKVIAAKYREDHPPKPESTESHNS
jgi:hypothetical protein